MNCIKLTSPSKIILLVLQIIAFLHVEKFLLAQEKPVLFHRVTEEEGLPTNEISGNIFQDSFGHLWISSLEGLVRYDGSRYKVFRAERNNPNSLISNDITSIVETSDRKLLIGSRSGLCLYDLVKENFVQLYSDAQVPNRGPVVDQVSRIEPEFNNRFWIVHDSQLSLFDVSTMKFRHFITKKGSKDYFASLRGLQLIKGSESKFYMNIERNGIFEWNNDSWTKFDIDTWTTFIFRTSNNLMLFGRDNLYIYNLSHGFSGKPEKWLTFKTLVKSIEEDNFGNIWFSTEKDGIFKVDISKKKILAHFHPSTIKGFPTEIIKLYCFGENIFALAVSGELVQINIHNESCKFFANDPSNPYSILRVNSYFANLFQDMHGVIYLVPEGVGYCYADLNQSKFQIIRNLPTDPYPIMGSTNRGIGANNTTEVWMGNNVALYHFDRSTKEFTTFPSKMVNSIYPDSNQQIWVGSVTLGHFYFNSKTRQLQLIHDYLPIEGDTTSLPDWYVTYLTRTRNNNLWVCTSRGIGEMVVPPKNGLPGKFRQYIYRPNDTNSLPGRMTWHLFEDTDGKLWVSTSSGIGVLDRKTGKFKQYIHKKDDPHSLSSNNVKCVAQDLKGRIWVSTEAGGLNLFNSKTDGFINYTINDGLSSNTIYALILDNHGDIWMSTKRGISVLDPDSVEFTNYSFSDGLQANSYNIQSFFKNETTGEILFGGPGGINIFHPDSIRKSNIQPNLVINRLVVNSIELRPGLTIEGNPILRKSITMTDSIRLKHNENSILLEFAVLQFSAPSNIKYRYKLDGFDKNWTESFYLQSNATYTNLSPGKYIFRLQGTNCDGLWLIKERTLHIEILPPWWATWWFRIALFLFVAGSAYGFYRYRVNALKREKRILETKVAERTAELSEANAQLEERQEEILTQKEELETKNEQISRAYDNMQLLSDFGQRITATLNLEAINQMIYDYVSSLMDTQAFGIGIYNEKRKVIEFLHFVEDGQVLPYFTKDLASAKSLSVRCFVNKEEIVIGNLGEEYKRYLATLPEVQTKKMPVSMVHLPLVVEGRAIGTLTVNSFRTDAYGPNELNNLRSLASYISIALDNASVYKVLRHTNEKVQNSIEYARTIQQAILPLREEMDKHFQSFVLFRPKDVVSGDFYWMQVVDGAIYFAVVDCTGHGVPGAFMSLIGSRLLDEIVKEKGIRQPSQILETLDHELGIALRQGDTENNDGMDICLIKLEHGKEAEEKTWTLTFSGAMRPLYLVQGGELKQLKGDRRSIGGKRTIRKTVIAFTDQSQVLDAGATLYLSSDGFADQNNGNHDKFGVIALEKLLTVMAPQPLNDQLSQLNKALDTHMGNEEQRDDITVVGIRL